MRTNRVVRLTPFGSLNPGGYTNLTATFIDTDGSLGSQAYKLYVPTTYDPASQWIAMVGLAGSGEYGTDNTSQLNAGLGKYVNNNLSTFPYVAILPQLTNPATMPGSPTTLAKKNCHNRIVLAGITHALRRANINPNRLHLTGFSAGGFRIPCIAAQNPTLFASLSTVEGGVSSQEFLNDAGATEDNGLTSGIQTVLASLPFRQYQHAGDGTVPVATYYSPIVQAFGGGSGVVTSYSTGHYEGIVSSASPNDHSDDWVYTDTAAANGYWSWVAAQTR